MPKITRPYFKYDRGLLGKLCLCVISETEIPPEGILGPSYRRPTPHIYSEKEIAAIMKSAKNLTPINGLRPHTYVTLFQFINLNWNTHR